MLTNFYFKFSVTLYVVLTFRYVADKVWRRRSSSQCQLCQWILSVTGRRRHRRHFVCHMSALCDTDRWHWQSTVWTVGARATLATVWSLGVWCQWLADDTAWRRLTATATNTWPVTHIHSLPGITRTLLCVRGFKM